MSGRPRTGRLRSVERRSAAGGGALLLACASLLVLAALWADATPAGATPAEPGTPADPGDDLGPTPPGGTATPAPAPAPTSAPPPDPSSGCMWVWRGRWYMPGRVEGSMQLDQFVVQLPGRTPDAAHDYAVQYCWEVNAWVLRHDNFLEHQVTTNPALCVWLYPNDEDPPDELGQLAEIDMHGTLDPGQGQGTVLEQFAMVQQYCRSRNRDGEADPGRRDEWTRQERPEGQFPPGAGPGPEQRDLQESAAAAPDASYKTWAQECETVISKEQTPWKVSRDPDDEFNLVWDSDPDELRDTVTFGGAADGDNGVRELMFGDDGFEITDLKLYCNMPGTSDWYRITHPVATDLLWQEADDRKGGPDDNECWVFVKVDQPPPDQLPANKWPSDYGAALPKDVYEVISKQPFDFNTMMCWLDGRWQSGVAMLQGCMGIVGVTGGSGSRVLKHGRGFLPDDCWGQFPTANYDIGFNGGSWDEFSRKITGWLTDFLFGIGTGATQISLWSVGWAYDFEMERFTTFGRDLGWDLSQNLTRNPRYQFFRAVWVVLIGYVAINILRGRSAMALGELLISFVLLTVTAVLMSGQVHYMTYTWRVMHESSQDLLVFAQAKDPTTDPSGGDRVIMCVQRELHRVFVEQPYDHISWGHDLTSPRIKRTAGPCQSEVPPNQMSHCERLRSEILATGPHGVSEGPRERMKSQGCTEEETFNFFPTKTRLLMATLSMVASLVGGVLLIAVALTIVVAKFVSLLLFGVLPLAVLTAVLPGGGRRIFWVWLTSVAQTVVAVIGMTLVLALLLRTLSELFDKTQDLHMVERFFLMLLLILIMSAARKKLLAASQSAASRWADNLSNVRLGAGAAWQGATGAGGINFNAVDDLMRSGARSTAGVGRFAGRVGMRTAGLAGRTAAAPVRFAGRSATTRWAERRAANRSIRNLVNKDILAGNLPAGTPSSSRGLRRAVNQARREHGDRYVMPKPEAAAGRAIPGRGGRGAPGASGDSRGNGQGQPASTRDSRWQRVKNAVRPHADSMGQRLQLDRARAGVLGAWDRTRDRTSYAVADRARRRWDERQQNRPEVRNPHWLADRRDERRAITRRYREAKANLREQARRQGFRVPAAEGRRLTADHRQEVRDHRATVRAARRERAEQERSLWRRRQGAQNPPPRPNYPPRPNHPPPQPSPPPGRDQEQVPLRAPEDE